MLCLLGFSEKPACGALLEAGHPRFGDGALTLDTTSQLAWLDLTHTEGMAFVDVVSQTNPGGAFEGFRPATDTEVFGLFQSAGIPHINVGSFQFEKASQNIDSAIALISLIGQTDSQDGYPEARGFLETTPNPSFSRETRLNAGLEFFYGNGAPGYEVSPYQGSYNESIPFQGFGTFLVRVIPEPTTCSLAAVMAFSAWGSWANRRRSLSDGHR